MSRNAARVPFVCLTLILLLPGSNASAGKGQGAGQDGWDFDLTVCAWLPTIDGKLNYDIPGSGDSFQVDLDTILDNLQMTGMLAFEARKGK